MFTYIKNCIKVATFSPRYVGNQFLKRKGLSQKDHLWGLEVFFNGSFVFCNGGFKVRWNTYLTLEDKAKIVDLYTSAYKESEDHYNEVKDLKEGWEYREAMEVSKKLEEVK